ncbi:MAG: aminotransferase class V-fold PLP-dependent enzyme [Rhodobacteraceae bacterium]|nr:aminotransferase class V-fold PLP-dependent enzyme [Paracoccaceae bacterium]
MQKTLSGILPALRDKFAHIATCPYQGDRVFFENAGGALTLKSVVETSSQFAAMPDNQGRDNPASHALVGVITQAKADMRLFFNAPEGQVFTGESGTELLFRLISAACLATHDGQVIGSTFEHPATRSACIRWAKIAGLDYISVPHNDETALVTAQDYARLVTPNTRVATILHTSPVTGMGVDLVAIVKTIRAVAPDCLIIVDGIQHAAHGRIDIKSYDIDGYIISPYKVFSRHGYGVAWISDRQASLPHDCLIGGPPDSWELGTRDTGSYATFSNVVDYFDWLGSQFTVDTDRRKRIVAAGAAIHAHEKSLTDAMLFGTGNLAGLADMPGVHIIGGASNPAREGLVSIYVDHVQSADIVSGLSDRGIRVHIRKDDHYSGNILTPLGRKDCIRISMCHYNSNAEVSQFLAAIREIIEPA